ncbi:MAG: MFS transporter [Amphiplicatus sp.]
MSVVHETAASVPAAAPSRAYRLYVLVLLTAVYTFNFIDRQIIGILSPYIKADLGLADWQLGLLKGFAFAVLYTTLGIPIARLADRYNRVTIISIALALWSGFTAISGAAMNFVHLLIARIGVGVGEAGGSPPSHSLISDYYPKENRAGALAFFAMGIPIGITLAYLGGGWITESLSWRWAFLAVGAPGLLLALLLKLTVREPKRGATDAPGLTDAFSAMEVGEPRGGAERAFLAFSKIMPARARAATFRELATLWRAARHLMSIPTYRLAVVAVTAISFGAYAVGTWIVDFFARSHPDYSMMSVLFWLGIINGTAYAAGTFLGGALVDRLARTNKAAYGVVPCVALLLHGPFFIGAMWVPDPVWSLILWAPAHLLIGFYLGPSFALAQTLAPVSIRALSTAIFFFVLNMIALGLGPTFVGVFSSILIPALGEELALRIALTSVIVSGLIGAGAFYLMSRKVHVDWAKATGEAP